MCELFDSLRNRLIFGGGGESGIIQVFVELGFRNDWREKCLTGKDYICDSHSPWPWGTKENTNRLLRQYFPKGTDLARYAQADIDKMALRVNQRPRKTLALQTPMETLQTNVAMTGRTQCRFF